MTNELVPVTVGRPDLATWAAAYRDGDPVGAILVSGSGFGMRSALRNDDLGEFFVYRTPRGSYLFAREGNTLKLCTSGLSVKPSPHGGWVASHASRVPGSGSPPPRAHVRSVGAPKPTGKPPSSSAPGHTAAPPAAHHAHTPPTYKRLPGLGNIFSVPASGLAKMLWTLGDLVPQGTYVQVYPTDPGGILEQATNLKGDLSTIVNLMSGSGSDLTLPPAGQYAYYAWTDPTEGAAWTPGEPAGLVILRVSVSTSGQVMVGMLTEESGYSTAQIVSGAPVTADTVQQDQSFFQTLWASDPTMQQPNTVAAQDVWLMNLAHLSVSSGLTPPDASGSGAAPFAGTMPIHALPSAVQQGEPPGDGIWWWQYMWRYRGGAIIPATPPIDPGTGTIWAPPGAAANPSGEVGKWVNVNTDKIHMWDWYPPGGQGGPYNSQVVGGDGVTYYVYASSDAALTAIATHSSGSPPPGWTPPVATPAITTPPPALAGGAGEWQSFHPYYFVWVPAAGTAPPTAGAAAAPSTTNGALIVGGVLGLGVLGALLYVALV